MNNLYTIILIIAFELVSIDTFSASVWNQKPNVPAVGRHRGSGLAIGNKGYIGLGHVNGTGVNVPYADWWEYDPATASWTQKADYPVANYGSAVFSTATHGYVGGGVFLNTEFYKFDPVTNTWDTIANAPIHVNDRIAFCVGKYGYITNGSLLYEYDTDNNSWTQKQSPPVNLNTWASACTFQNSGYVKSGSNFLEYKPSSDTWLTKSVYPGLVSNGGVAFSANDRCYFLLGFSGSLGNVLKEMYEYNPANDSWIALPEFPGTSRRFSCAFSINNVGYLGTGTNGINFNDFWEYNRVLNTLSSPLSSHITVSTFPNPATDYINFKLTDSPSNQNINIYIYTLQGALVKSVICQDLISTVNLMELPTGRYLYVVKSTHTTVKSGHFQKN